MDIWQSLVQDIKFESRPKTDGRGVISRGEIHSNPSPVQTNDPEEAANVFRKLNSIRVQGSNIPAPVQAFGELSGADLLQKSILQSLVALKLKCPTAIQSQVLPLFLRKRDVLAISPTGSGKTLAFVLPILAGIARQAAGQKPYALIMAPTRELVHQTARVVEDFRPLISAKLTCACITQASAAGAEFGKVDVIVTTPLRLSRLVRRKKVDLQAVQYLVLDEADKLLELKSDPHTVSHVHQVDRIMGACSHPDLVIGIFSATIPESVEALSKNFLKDPVRVTVGDRNASASNIDQQLQFAGSEEGKILLLQQLLTEGLKAPVLIFVSSKDKAILLQRKLVGYRVDSIFSDKDYRLRQRALDTFRSGETWLLISTDVLARGIDFVNIQTVVNYDCPSSIDDYVHRIGRTGRGGSSGAAVTFFTEEDGSVIRSIAHMATSMGQTVPPWMLTMPKRASNDRPNRPQKKRQKHEK